MCVTLLNCSKCSKYNPNESTKQFDKTVVRKQAVLFSPTTVLEHLRGERATSGRAAGKAKEDLLQLYMQVCGGGGRGDVRCVGGEREWQEWAVTTLWSVLNHAV